MPHIPAHLLLDQFYTLVVGRVQCGVEQRLPTGAEVDPTTLLIDAVDVLLEQLRQVGPDDLAGPDLFYRCVVQYL